MKTSSSIRHEATVFAILAGLLPLLLYLHALSYAFVYDDSELIVSRLPPGTLHDWLSMALSPYYRGLPYYRPLPGLLFAFERLVFDLNPFGYHLTNLLIASASGIALFSLLRLPLFSLPPLAALAISAICSAHPVTSSVVYMISGREALLSVFFLILTCRFSLQGGFEWRAAAALFCALACRESSVSILPLPGLMLLARLRDPTRGPALAGLLRLAGVVVLYLTLRHFALRGEDAATHLAGNWLLIPLSYLYAFSSIFTPSPMLRYEPELLEWLTVPRMALLTGSLLSAIVILRQSRAIQNIPVRCTLLLALISLLPTANIFQQETLFDERHLLAPMILLVICLGIAVHRLLERNSAMSARWIALPLLFLMPISFMRGTSFRSDDSFFDHWISLSPDNSKVINHIAARAMSEERLPEALELLNRSIALRGNSSAFLYRGRIHRLMKNYAEAQSDIQSALDLDPGDAIAWCDFGMLEQWQGNWERAMSHYEQASERSQRVWCAATRHQKWEDEITVRGDALRRYPISTREELRNFDESARMPRDD